MVLLGTSKETRKTPEATSAVSPPNPITHHESQMEDDIGTVSGRLSFVSPVSSPGTSKAFSIMNTKPSFTKPAVQEWSSDHNNPLPATILSPGSVSNKLTGSLSSSVSVSPEHSSIIKPSATTSPTMPWAQGSSPGYVSQAALPASFPPTQPQQKTPSIISVSTDEPTKGTASQHYLDTSRNSLKSPAAYIAYSLPSTQAPTSAPRYSRSSGPFSPVVHSTSISSESPSSPGYTLPAETQNFNAVNTLGLINVFELYSDPEPQANLEDCIQPLKESLPSQQAGLEPSKSAHLPLYPEPNRSPRATYFDFAIATESLAETMTDLSAQRPETQVSPAEMPHNLVFAQSQSCDSFKELSTTFSWEQTATSRFEMSGDASTEHFVWPNFTTEVPAGKDNDVDELHIPRQRAASHPPTFVGMSPPTVPQLHQSKYQYHQPMAPWPNTQAQISRTQPKYQAYSPPSPILSEQEHLAGQTSTSPPMEAATPVQPAESTLKQGYPLLRSMTAGEARRRNQKALLNLIGRPGGYG
jgi:hypothetical protein